MRIAYSRETDSLYIDLWPKVGADAREVAPGIVLDFDNTGSVVGIDIQHASKVVDLKRLDTEAFPFLPQDDVENQADAGES